MMVLTRTAAVLLLVLGAGVGSAAGQDERPPFRTIEVRVVYADTKEPVWMASLEIVREDGVAVDTRMGYVPDGRFTAIVWPEQDSETYNVTVGGCGPSPWIRSVHCASFFIHHAPGMTQTVTLTREQPNVKVVFEVERGWGVSGTVRARDGSPVCDALVMVEQGASREEWAYGNTSIDGEFTMLGVVPAERVPVRIESVVQAAGFRTAGTVLLYTGEIALAGEATQADFDVDVTALYLTVDVALPLWPFGRVNKRLAPVVGIWAEHDPTADPVPPEPDLVFDFPLSLSWVPKRTLGLAPYVRHNYLVRNLPTGKTVTVGVGFKDMMQDEPYNPAAGCTFHGYQIVTLTTPTRSVDLGLYAPRARASRVFWIGLVVLVILAVCVPILVLQIRKRRGQGAGQKE
jgi:hypothetical protein